MVKILNYGSLNIDHVYLVDDFVKTGETLSSDGYHQYCGGKGLNQSIALAYAGAQVYHAGKIGPDGQLLKDKMEKAGINTQFVAEGTEPTGHALIQVNKEGNNCIILYGGSNQRNAEEEIDQVLDFFSKGDYLLLQNEINNIDFIIKKASLKNLKIVMNPAPMNDRVLAYPLDLVDLFIVNETEGQGLTGEIVPEKIIKNLRGCFPGAAVVLTLGPEGAVYQDEKCCLSVSADKGIKVADTTAAGDTFIGYFLGELSIGSDIEKALNIASKACDICVSRSGASSSIPKRIEIKV